MRILALDTASPRIGAALLVDDAPPLVSFHEGGDRSAGILPLIDSLLSRGGLSIGDLDRIAVVVGPGSFTGIRVGLATVLGLVAPLSDPPELAGIGTLAAIRRAAGRPEALVLLRHRRGEWAVGHDDGREEVLASGQVPRAEEVIMFPEEAEIARGEGILLPGARIHDGWCEALPEAVARIGAQAHPVSPEELVPRYLKAPYARV